MEFVIYLLSSFSLAYLIKELDGPWGIMAWIRNCLIRNKYVGVFFYKLLSCYYCTSFHTGWMIYLLTQKNYAVNLIISWSLASAIFSLILDAVLARLTIIKDE